MANCASATACQDTSNAGNYPTLLQIVSSVFAFGMWYKQLTHCVSWMIAFGPKVLGCLGLSATASTGMATQPAVLNAAMVEGEVSSWAVQVSMGWFFAAPADRFCVQKTLLNSAGAGIQIQCFCCRRQVQRFLTSSCTSCVLCAESAS